MLLLVVPFLGLRLCLFVLYFLHEEGKVCVFLEIARQYLIIFCQKLLIILFGDQVSLLLHQLHVPHVELRIGLDLLDDADQILS